MSRFPKLSTGLFREFRKSYNEGVEKVDEELNSQKKRVDRLIIENPQPSEVVDARGNHPVLGDRINSVESHLAQTANRVGVTYEQFGAKLDGVTDDTVAIQNAHNFANEHGLNVVQRNATFVLNGKVDVKTNVDLSGSTLITSYKEAEDVEYNRSFNLFKIQGEEENITLNVNQTEFKKGATSIPSLAYLPPGSITITTSDIDLVRNDGGTLYNVHKAESNATAQEGDGSLLYPLTKDYSTSSGFKVTYQPLQSKLTFTMPNVVLDNAKLRGIIESYRNNVEIKEGTIKEINHDSEKGSLYTVGEFINSHNVKIDNVSCPQIGRNEGIGQFGRGYFFIFTRSSMIRCSGLSQLSGWSGINGNWFRDIIVENSTLLSSNGHANTYDMTVRDTSLMGSIALHGGGVLHVENVKFLGTKSTIGVTTKTDYGSEFEGLIRVVNCETNNIDYLVQLQGVNYNPTRKVTIPDVIIDNVRMKGKDRTTYAYVFRGWGGNFETNVPKVSINNVQVSEELTSHRTVYLAGTFANTLISGTMLIDIINCHIPKQLYDKNLYSEGLMNIRTPKIQNNLKVVMNIQNSTCNLGIEGTSNVTLNVKDSDIVSMRSVTSSASDSVTTHGEPFVMNIDNCRLHRVHNNFEPVAGDRFGITVTNSSYYKYFKLTGESDNYVAYNLNNSITYAKNNRAIVDGVLPPSRDRLFDYMNTSIWKTS